MKKYICLLVYICASIQLGSSSVGKRFMVSYEPDTLSILRNPAMGWVMYEEGWSFKPSHRQWYDPVRFWQEMDAVQAHQYANILYIRVLWNVLEPEEGKYAWIYNEEYKAYIQKAKDRGLKLAFRVFFDNGVPDFVYQAGAHSTLEPPLNREKDKMPYFDDSVFLEKLSNFVKAFAKEYDDPDVVDFVDAYGLGRWGEGHGVTLKDKEKLPFVIETVTSTYARCFKRVLTVMNLSYADWQYTKPIVFDRLGFLPRRDGIGSFWFGDEDRKYLNELFPQKAHIGEGCYWFAFPHKDSTTYDAFKRDKRFKMNSFYDAFTVAVDDALATHSNTLDLRVPYQCKYWIEQLPHQVQRFITHGGYRLYPQSIEVEQQGKTLCIRHTWFNLGVGVLPNRHPNWNQKYKVSFALLDPGTKEIKYNQFDPDAEPADWVAGTAYTYTTRLGLTKGIKKGEYLLCVAIVDSTKGYMPGIKLSLPTEHLVNDWTYINKVKL
ncbi:MAG: hypothetical protein ACK5HZ_00045 [Macellibacteroides fermentans]|uniref:hypothetical protein n=1 Tax=Macellibacteroides fermentans TaxID=879969 RepID=UPI003AC43BF7